MTALRFDRVTFAYDRMPVLEEVNFTVEEKDFLAVIGPNGGGKSTLLKLALGLLRPQHGEIEVFGESPFRARRYVGYVPQITDVNVGFPVTVEEVIMMGFRGNRSALPFRTRHEKRCAAETLAKVGLDNALLTRKIGELSGGQRQRVMIARALCSYPRMLMLDEPTASIDAAGQKAIYDLLKELNAYVTVVVVSHDLSVILEYANKALYVNKHAAFHDIADKRSVFHTHGDVGHFCEVELLQMLGAQGCRECTRGEDA